MGFAAERRMQTQQLQSQRTLAAAVAQFSEGLAGLAPSDIISDGLRLIRQQCAADSVTLYSIREQVVTPLGTSPLSQAATETYSASWFPWGLHMAQPQRFLLVQQAEMLPAAPATSQTLGELGVRSCVHLPIVQRQQLLGALQLFWCTPRQTWEDSSGQILRSLGRLLLAISESETAPDLNQSRAVHPG
jgi:GAF domain-containing protein